MVFKREPLELLPEIRVRNPDERPGSLRDRFAFQIDDAVLGDHVHHIRAWRGHDVSLREIEHETAAAPPRFSHVDVRQMNDLPPIVA